MVFIVTDEPFPNGMASTRRIHCYARALALAGVSVEILCFHRTEVFGSKVANPESSGTLETISFRYIGGTTRREAGLLKRKFNDYRDKIQTLRYLKRNLYKGDAVLYYSVNHFPTLAPMVHSCNCKIYRDFCEYPYATKRTNLLTEFRCHLYMRTLFRQFDGAICISKPLFELAEKFHSKGRHLIAPIFVDPLEWDFTTKNNIDFPYILHSGTIDEQKDGILDILVAFAEALPSLPSDVKYLFTGNIDSSTCKKELQSIIAKYSLSDHVDFLGYLSKEQLSSYLAHSYCFIINKPDNVQNRYCFSTKLGEYLLTGNPVIINDRNVALEYLDEKSAFIFNTEDKDALVNKIIEVFSNRGKARCKGLAGREICLNKFSINHHSLLFKKYFVG